MCYIPNSCFSWGKVFSCWLSEAQIQFKNENFGGFFQIDMVASVFIVPDGPLIWLMVSDRPLDMRLDKDDPHQIWVYS